MVKQSRGLAPTEAYIYSPDRPVTPDKRGDCENENESNMYTENMERYERESVGFADKCF